MLQYLVNTTAIWLISLLMFDLFLRKETYHNYNRGYLLVTFLLGSLLPIWQWQGDTSLAEGAIQLPVERIIAAKQNIVAAATPASDIDWTLWIAVIYGTGAFVALSLLLLDIIKMAVLCLLYTSPSPRD